MTRLRLLLLTFILLSWSAAATLHAASGAGGPRTMKFPPLSYEIPGAERIVLDCGMPVYLLQDRELPIISITAMVHTGSVYDPPRLAGMAAMTGSVMRSGGAGGAAPEAIDDELEYMASSVESGIGPDMGTVSMTSLTKNFPATLRIFSNVLLRPDFDGKRVDLARKHAVEGIRRRNDDPKEIAGREIVRAIYAGHPLGMVPEVETVTAVTREEMTAFHRRYFRVDNMVLAVSGSFERDRLLKELNAVFGSVRPAEPLSVMPIPQPGRRPGTEVMYGRKAVSQSVIRMGHLGISKDDPDLYAIRLLDYILGGSFTSRLTMEIRTNRGLAYSVGSHFDIGRSVAGSFIAETETKAGTTAQAVGLMKEIITGVTREPVTEQELALAKEYILNSFMFGFTSAASIVTQRARLEYYGYPADYLEKYRDNISRVTREGLLAAARRHLKPDSFKLVVIGDADGFDRPLAEFGPVRELDPGRKPEAGKGQ